MKYKNIKIAISCLAKWLFCIGLLLAMGFGGEVVRAEEIFEEKLSMELYVDNKIIDHTEDEIYYLNSQLEFAFPKDIGVPSKVTDEIEHFKETYPEDVDYYVEELYGRAEYNGDEFLAFENIDKTHIVCENEKTICKFRVIKSYKIFRNNDGSKEILEILDYKYISPPYQVVIDKGGPEIKPERDIPLDGRSIFEDETVFVIKDEIGLCEIELVKNDKTIDTVNLVLDKRIVEYEYSIELKKENEGIDNVIVKARDLAGNVSEYKFSYFIDKEAPKLKVYGVENEKVYADSVALNIDLSDDSGRVYLYYKCTYMNEAGDETELENITIEQESGSRFSKNYEGDGIYDVVFFVYDESGNYSDVYSVSFGIDSKAPTLLFENVENLKKYKDNVTLAIVVNELFFDTASVELSGIINDKSGVRSLELSSYELGARNNKRVYTFDSDGKYSIAATAKDSKGHSENKSCEFVIDKSAPDVEIYIGDEIAEGNKISGILNNRPSIRVKAHDEFSEYSSVVVLYKNNKDSGYVEVDRANVVSVGMATDFTMEVPTEGEYIIKGIFTDDVGNLVEKVVNFTVDENPPVIGYINDFNGRYLKYFTLPKQFSDYISDMTRTKYKAYLNAKEVGAVDITKDGKYIVQIVAEDEAGNQSEEMAAFIVDNTLPKVVVSGMGSEGQVKKDDIVKLTLLDEDDYFKRVFVNGNSIDLNNEVNENKEVLVKADEYGDYDISVVAADYAGNEVTEVIKMRCNMAKNPFTVKIDSNDIETLTKNDEEIRESFFDKKDNLEYAITIAIIVATGVILVVFTFVDTKKNKG